jgi:hypothetical protein
MRKLVRMRGGKTDLNIGINKRANAKATGTKKKREKERNVGIQVSERWCVACDKVVRRRRRRRRP